MAKAVFYVKDKVQDVGYRLFIISKILNSDLEGTALNMLDGRIKVLLEGDRDHIIQFYKELLKEKPELAGNPMASEPKFDDSLTVPTTMRSSQELLLNQFSKGVTYLSSMNDKLDKGFGGVGKKLDELPDKISGRLEKKLDELPERISGRLEKKLDELPDKISGRLEKKLDELPDKISGRLERKLDELPGKFAEALRS